jgi:hypothetical protein
MVPGRHRLPGVVIHQCTPVTATAATVAKHSAHIVFALHRLLHVGDFLRGAPMGRAILCCTVNPPLSIGASCGAATATWLGVGSETAG